MMCALDTNPTRTDSTSEADGLSGLSLQTLSEQTAVQHVEGFPVGKLSNSGHDCMCGSELPIVWCIQVGSKLSIRDV